MSKKYWKRTHMQVHSQTHSCMIKGNNILFFKGSKCEKQLWWEKHGLHKDYSSSQYKIGSNVGFFVALFVMKLECRALMKCFGFFSPNFAASTCYHELHRTLQTRWASFPKTTSWFIDIHHQHCSKLPWCGLWSKYGLGIKLVKLWEVFISGKPNIIFICCRIEGGFDNFVPRPL